MPTVAAEHARIAEPREQGAVPRSTVRTRWPRGTLHSPQLSPPDSLTEADERQRQPSYGRTTGSSVGVALWPPQSLRLPYGARLSGTWGNRALWGLALFNAMPSSVSHGLLASNSVGPLRQRLLALPSRVR